MKVFDWDGLIDVVDAAFNIWSGHPELRWAEEAWGILAGAGLTAYTSPLARVRVVCRFFALVGFYHDFCHLAFEETVDPTYSWWTDSLEVHPFFIGQLLGGKEDWSGSDLEPDLDAALRSLANAERDAVVKALLAHYGSESALFIALWRSRQSEPSPAEEDEEEDDTWRESDWEIVNDVTFSKLEAFSWLTEGGYPIL